MLKVVIESETNKMIFSVINKNDNTLCAVYDITYNNAGYPHFLTYKNGQWLRLSAKYFRPIESSDFDEFMIDPSDFDEFMESDDLKLEFYEVI